MNRIICSSYHITTAVVSSQLCTLSSTHVRLQTTFWFMVCRCTHHSQMADKAIPHPSIRSGLTCAMNAACTSGHSNMWLIHKLAWTRTVVVCWSRSTKLTYVGPGYYWDGWPCHAIFCSIISPVLKLQAIFSFKKIQK